MIKWEMLRDLRAAEWKQKTQERKVACRVDDWVDVNTENVLIWNGSCKRVAGCYTWRRTLPPPLQRMCYILTYISRNKNVFLVSPHYKCNRSIMHVFTADQYIIASLVQRVLHSVVWFEYQCIIPNPAAEWMDILLLTIPTEVVHHF